MKWRCLREGESGQALVESGLLLAALLGGLAAGGIWLMRTQTDLLRAIGNQFRGAYFWLSLPFP
jgi:hypothetical protein